MRVAVERRERWRNGASENDVQMVRDEVLAAPSPRRVPEDRRVYRTDDERRAITKRRLGADAEKKKEKEKRQDDRVRVEHGMGSRGRTVELFLEVHLRGDGREDRHEGEEGQKLRHFVRKIPEELLAASKNSAS